MEYSEIVTKAVIGKGKKNYNTIHELIMDQTVSKVLGCWIINHVFDAVQKKQQVEIRGQYDLHVWYGYEQDQQSQLYKKTIEYIEELPIHYKNPDAITDQLEIKAFCSKYPTCSALKLLSNGNIEASVDKEFIVDVVGEAKLRVQISPAQKDEWAIEDDIDRSVNVNYIQGN